MTKIYELTLNARSGFKCSAKMWVTNDGMLAIELNGTDMRLPISHELVLVHPEQKATLELDGNSEVARMRLTTDDVMVILSPSAAPPRRRSANPHTAPLPPQELDAIRARAGIITGPTWQHLYRQADADRAALLAEVDRLHEAFEFAGTGLLQYLKNLQQTKQDESP